MPRLYKSTHLSHPILPFLHAFWSARNRLRLWTLTLQPFQQKGITDLGGLLCLSNHPLIYHHPSLTFTYSAPLHPRWKEKAQTPSVYQRTSYPRPRHTVSFGPLFFCFSFATCQKPVITDSAARHGCEYQSAFSWSLIHLTCTACGRDS